MGTEHTGDAYLTPVTGITDLVAIGDSLDIEINDRSKTFYIAIDSDSDMTETDAFALQRKNIFGFYKNVFDINGQVLLGATRTEFDVINRGVFRVVKILATAVEVGIATINGFERAK